MTNMCTTTFLFAYRKLSDSMFENIDAHGLKIVRGGGPYILAIILFLLTSVKTIKKTNDQT
jgi:hypothetical protein